MTKKKRIMIVLSDEDLLRVEQVKIDLGTKQLSKVIHQLLNVYFCDYDNK